MMTCVENIFWLKMKKFATKQIFLTKVQTKQR
jgi:hypothetical protein